MSEPTKRPRNLPPAPEMLWDWLEKKDLNQRQGAKILKVPFATMNHYLHNRRRPSLERLDHIFNLTGIPIALWLEPHVGKVKTSRRPHAKKPLYLQGGNAHVG